MRTWLHKQPTQCCEMSFFVIFGFYILQHMQAVEAVCSTRYADFGAQNVQLSFNYSWSAASKIITCTKNQTTIGQCAGTLAISCSLEQTSVGVFKISSNTDLTSLSITVLNVNETTTGTYSCSKPSNTDTQTIILEETPVTASDSDTTVLDGYKIGVIFVSCVLGIITIIWCIWCIWYFCCRQREPAAVHPDNTLTVNVVGLPENADTVDKQNETLKTLGIDLLDVELEKAEHYVYWQQTGFKRPVFKIRCNSLDTKTKVLAQCKNSFKLHYEFQVESVAHTVDWVYVM